LGCAFDIRSDYSNLVCVRTVIVCSALVKVNGHVSVATSENEALTRRLNKPSVLLALLCEVKPTDERVLVKHRADSLRVNLRYPVRCCSSASRLFGPLEALQALPDHRSHFQLPAEDDRRTPSEPAHQGCKNGRYSCSTARSSPSPLPISSVFKTHERKITLVFSRAQSPVPPVLWRFCEAYIYSKTITKQNSAN
jgi:hypothetical protein